MTNREFYKEEILDIACRRGVLAVSKSGKPVDCGEIRCADCKFHDQPKICRQMTIKWCNEEYVEPCEFEKDELVEVSQDGIEWVLGYFSHDTCGLYFTYANGWKSEDCVSAVGYKYCRKYGTLGGLVKE